MRYHGIIVSNGGKVRANNEDNALLNGYFRKNDNEFQWSYECKLSDGFLASVFDGMGGEEHGEIASRIAAEQMSAINHKDFMENIEGIIKNVNSMIVSYAKGKNMGTTYAGVSVEGDFCYFSNVGDSRGYLFRNENLMQMTKDHNMVQELLKRGVLTKEQAERHPDRNALYQYLGIELDGEKIELETYVSERVKLCSGDICLLCSDGLTNMLEDEEIEQILDEDITLKKKADCLIEGALEAGGRDNITVVLIEASE